MVGIVGDVSGVTLESFTGRVRERVPNRWLAPIFVYCAFALIGGGGAAPFESRRELLICLWRLGECETRQGSAGESGRGAGRYGLGESTACQLVLHMSSILN